MPTILRSGPYRFFFYAGDGADPAHVHVERDDCEAKCWLDPPQFERARGFTMKELNKPRGLVARHQWHSLEAWNEFFHD
jgi:hypothetical protein